MARTFLLIVTIVTIGTIGTKETKVMTRTFLLIATSLRSLRSLSLREFREFREFKVTFPNLPIHPNLPKLPTRVDAYFSASFWSSRMRSRCLAAATKSRLLAASSMAVRASSIRLSMEPCSAFAVGVVV